MSNHTMTLSGKPLACFSSGLAQDSEEASLSLHVQTEETESACWILEYLQAGFPGVAQLPIRGGIGLFYNPEGLHWRGFHFATLVEEGGAFHLQIGQGRGRNSVSNPSPDSLRRAQPILEEAYRSATQRHDRKFVYA